MTFTDSVLLGTRKKLIFPVQNPTTQIKKMSLKYAPTVQTEAGPVRGFIQEVEFIDGKETGEVLLYQAIPYGKKVLL